MRMRVLSSLLLAGVALAACSSSSSEPPQMAAGSYGADPALPAPWKPRLFPVVHIAPASSWGAGQTPTAAAGLAVKAFAAGLDHPRWLYVLPNGDVLVAETNGPGEAPHGGLFTRARNWVQGKVMAGAGAKAPSANRLTLLRDADGDGVAETRMVFLSGLRSPFGMALVGNQLYVANTDGVVRVPYQTGQTSITATPQAVTDLPGGPINHHWTKNIIAAPDGRTLYATVGSNSNVGENGIPAERGRAAIWRIDLATGAKSEFATGLRNPNGMDFEPGTNVLWTVANERDELGNDLVPDYLTSVRQGAFYGWPYSYYGQHVDSRVKDQRPDLVARAVAPDYALGAHTASLGLTFSRHAAMLPTAFGEGAFVGQHGSWNRQPRAGYKVIFVPFTGGRPAGRPVDVLTGFVNGRGQAQGRPVGVVIDRRGGLLVADDVGNTIWRVIGRP